jgi:predicted transglutaminase-like cysteine proteinase
MIRSAPSSGVSHILRFCHTTESTSFIFIVPVAAMIGAQPIPQPPREQPEGERLFPFSGGALLTGHTLPWSSMTSGDLIFFGYHAFDAAPDDPMRLKWNAVRATFDAAPLYGVPLDLDAIEQENLEINTKVHYVAEPPGVDVWQPPAYTWAHRSGDCEDYAILKYAMLLKSGLPEDRLRLVVGAIKSLDAPDGRFPHAWCAAYLEDAWRVLDNKFYHLIKPEEYVNWIPIFAASGTRAVRYGQVIAINDFVKAKP